MKFDLTKEQTALQDTVDRFLQEELDRTRLLQIFDNDHSHDENFWQALTGIGAPGVMIPETCGGVGLGRLDAAVVAEALGRHAAPGPFLGSPSVHRQRSTRLAG